MVRFCYVLLKKTLIEEQVEELIARQRTLMIIVLIHIVDALEQRRIADLLLHVHIAEKSLEMSYVEGQFFYIDLFVLRFLA